MKTLLTLLLVLSTSEAYGQESDKAVMNKAAAELTGQVMACGGDPQFGVVQKYVRDKIWFGAADFNKLYQEYKAQQNAAREQQVIGSQGLSCDDVKKNLAEFVDKLSVAQPQ